MRILFGIFFHLVFASISENPLRDKVRISSCEGPNGEPEMTIVGPDYILNGNGNEENGQTIERKVSGEKLTMKTNDKCEFKNDQF